MRFWNNDILRNTATVLEAVMAAVDKSVSVTSPGDAREIESFARHRMMAAGANGLADQAGKK